MPEIEYHRLSVDDTMSVGERVWALAKSAAFKMGGRGMKGTRWVIGIALIGVCLISGWESPASDTKTGLIVHEWGTFSSFSGSDGRLLPFHPENTDLPKFVYRGE